MLTCQRGADWMKGVCIHADETDSNAGSLFGYGCDNFLKDST